MSGVLIALCITGALACGALGFLYQQAYRDARRQMEAHLRPDRGAPRPALRRLEDWFATTGPGEAAADYLAKSGLPLSPLKYALALAAIGLFLYWFASGFLAIGPWGGLSAAMIGLPLLTRAYLQHRREQFLAKLQLQLPEIASMLSNALKAGYSLSQALHFVGEQARPPARAIFARCREEGELGRPLDATLSDLIRRYDSPDLRLMLATMLIQKQTGGNLIAALDGIAQTIRRRQETLGEVRATLARAQQTVRVLPFLPFVSALMFNIALPGFLAPLFTLPGMILLAVVITLQVAAAWLIRRMTWIEV